MNWPDDLPEQVVPEEDVPEEAVPGGQVQGDQVQGDQLLKVDGVEQGSDQALYQGDCGELSLDARRVLVQLLAGPSLDGQRHSRLWPVLIRDEMAIRRRLSELFLQLVIDRDLQVAFTRQAETGDLEVPRLLRRANLTLLDSILLLHLRQRLTQAEAHGDRAVVSTDEIVEFFGVYEHAGNTDRALFQKRIHASIEKIKKHSILRRIRSSEDRFEISPTLKLLFSAEEIQALTRIYYDMRAPQASSEQDEEMQSGEGRE